MTEQDKYKGFIPVIDVLVDETDLMTAVVFGKVWRYCQMPKHRCYAAIPRLAKECGISVSSVQRRLKKLCELGYLKDTTPDLKNKPHIYIDTGVIGLATQTVAGKMDEITQDAPGQADRVPGQRDRACPVRVTDEDSSKDSIQESIDNAPSGALSTKEETPKKDRYAALRPTLECDHSLFSRFNAERREKGYGRCTKFTNATIRDKFRRAATRLDGNLDTAIEGAFEAGLGSLPKIVAYVDRWKPGGYVKPGRNNKTSMTQNLEWLQEI